MSTSEPAREPRRKGIAGRVLLGMVIGIVLGLVLMHFEPVPVQPKDEWTAKIAGTAYVVKAGEKVGAEVAIAELDIPAGDETLSIVGLKPEEAKRKIEARLGLTLEDFSLDTRGAVTIRPAVTEAVYIAGQLFIRLLRMLVIPLIASTMLIGIASLGSARRLGRLGAQTVALYFGTMFVAVLIGMTYVALIGPGRNMPMSPPEAAEGGLAENPSVADLMLRIVPDNPFESIVRFDILGLLFFVIMLGLAMLHVGKHRAAPVFNFFESLSDLVMVLINWVLRLAPIGVAALIAYYVGVQDPEHLGHLASSLGKYAATLSLGLVTHFIALLVLVAVLARYSPIEFVKRMFPAISTAFGTSSSNATMPVTLASVKSMGVSKRISGFVVPTGATMNMDGTALFEAVAVIFFAQWYGFDLSFGQQIIVGLTAVLAAVGAAGIPSAGLVTMAIVLTAVGLPVAGIGLLFAIDRPLDMLRTVVNISGDGAVSRIVQTWNPDIDPADDDVATEYEPIDPRASHDLDE